MSNNSEKITVQIEKLPKSEVKLVIEVPAEKMNDYAKLAAKKLNEEVKITGFRPGKIPEDVLRNHLGEETFEAYVIDVALPQAYAEVVVENKIDVISRPTIEIIQKKPLKFSATVSVTPELKLGDYKKISLPKLEQKISSEEIEDIKKSVQKKYTTYKFVDRPVAKGDRVEVDFEGFDEGGVKLDGTASKNHPVVIGDSTMIPGFEDQLIGMKKDQEKTFNITFPQDYHHKPFQSKKVQFKVLMKSIEEGTIPELNDELVEKHTEAVLREKMSSKKFDQYIEDQIKQEKDRHERLRREKELIDELLKQGQIDISDTLIQEELEDIKARRKQEFERQGLNYQDMYEKELKSNPKMEEQLKQQAEKQRKIRFIIREIIKLENISITKNELEAKIMEILHNYPESQRQDVRAEIDKDQDFIIKLENNLLLDKFYDFFLEK